LTWSFLAMLVAISCGCDRTDTEQQDGSSKAEQESEATSGPDLSDPEKLAIAILDTLIQGDKEAYASFATPPKDEWKKIIQEQLPSLENDPNAAFLRDKSQSSLERIDKNFQRARINSSEEWEAISENGKNDGINWSEAMFIRSKFEIQERMIPELGNKKC